VCRLGRFIPRSFSIRDILGETQQSQRSYARAGGRADAQLDKLRRIRQWGEFIRQHMSRSGTVGQALPTSHNGGPTEHCIILCAGIT
jgi:hypothetical protein